MATTPLDAADSPLPASEDEHAPPGFSPTPSARVLPQPMAFRQQVVASAEGDEGEYEEFLRFVRGRRPPARARRNQEDDDDDYERPEGDRCNAGPPPSWDGSSSFKDYAIRARLWLATIRRQGLLLADRCS